MHRRWPRVLIAISPVVAIVALLIALAGPGGERVEDLSAWPSGLEANEAPMLAKRVAEGRLPPLSQRLPERPLVARHDYAGYEGPGRYGGTWRRFDTNPQFASWKMVGGYAPLVRWRFDCLGLEPGLAESWQYNDDGTALTLHLRKGLKWSDGHPYTSADFAFFYELCLRNEAQLIPPVWCLVGGKPMAVETPDETTIVMKFAGPNWLVPLWLATGFWENEKYNIPKHYMVQFHPRYNPAVTAGDFTEFSRKNLPHQNPDRPTMWPWRLKECRDGGYYVLLERNPYYYVVDDLHRQLPYIDRVVSKLIPDQQVQVLKMLAGEIDCQYRGIQVMDLALFLKGTRSGRYRIKMWESTNGAEPGILVNWSAPDPVLRGLIRDRRFRRALALGIDREKGNQIAWRGMCTPQGSTISEESWHFAGEEGRRLFEEWKSAFAEYNLDKANTLLDEMGLTRRDAEGYRLRRDGERLTLVMDVTDASGNRMENDMGLIIAEGWRRMGIDAIIYTPPGAERSLRITLGKYTISMHSQAEMDLFTYPDWVFPAMAKYWHPKVGRWYETGGTEGDPPTPGDPLDRLLKIYDRIKKEKELAKRHELVHQAVRIHIDEGPFVLGTVARSPAPVLVGRGFHNVPDKGILGPWAPAGPGSSYPEQCWMDPEARQ
ncbi:MAG TPA: ABC transporter substrate-binding protein [Phycisphaerae bacterium]|nr:ABC transporter substrate-binding protein [Phycisphaerae bacterium]